MRRALSTILLALAGPLAAASPALAAGPPQVASAWVTDVTASSANLRALINPNGLNTTYRFEYIDEASYEANLGAQPPRDGFFGAAKAPPSGATGIGAGTSEIEVLQHLSALAPLRAYRYRPVATNSAGTTIGPARALGTEAASSAFSLPDGRGWEMVSPVDKNGGDIPAPGSLFGGGVFQAAAGGGSLTYSSAFAFGTGQAGSPPGSQYLAVRSGGGWATQNITTPLLSGSYGDRPDGVPYQLFSSDLERALLANGERCRGSDGECPVANPPLPGSGAPAGFENYYLRSDSDFAALLDAADLSGPALAAERFGLSLAGASPDLSHVVLSSCSALAPGAREAPSPGACDPAEQNLYEWSAAGLALLNLEPAATESTPGASLAAPAGAISDDGSRVYWTAGGSLYLREAGATKAVDAAQGGEGTFEVASGDGSVAFFSEAQHLFRYVAASGVATDLTPSGGVLGVLGASADGSSVYYQTNGGLQRWRQGETSSLAAGADASTPGSYPPATGSARVSADGEHLLFSSVASLTGYDNAGVQELFLYGPPPGGGAPQLLCVSCNPTGERPRGPASVPGVRPNGDGPTALAAYKPRVLLADGSVVFFDSADSLAIQDTNGEADVYQWRAQGSGGCARSGGCIGLISSGRSGLASSLIDASGDGTDVFFRTESSLVADDPGSFDIYDARVGGGFPPMPRPIPCNGDACQSLPAAPDDPTPGTLVENGGNPPLRFPKASKKKSGKKKHRGKRRHKSQRGRGGRR